MVSVPVVEATSREVGCRSTVLRASLIAVVALLVGCTQQGKVTTYTPEVEINFNTSCGARADQASGGTNLCSCVYATLKSSMEFADFKRLDADLRQGTGDSSIASAGDLRQKFPAYTTAVASCIETGPKAP